MSLAEVWRTYRQIRRARQRKYPLIFYITMDNQLAVLTPYRVVGPLLMFRFQGQECRVLYDKTKAVWFMGRPAIFVREGQLYPVDFARLAYLQYVHALAPLYANAVAGLLETLKKEGGGAGEQQGSPNPGGVAEYAEAVLELLRSDHPIDRLNGVVRAAELLRRYAGDDWLAQLPLDPSVLDQFRPREEDLNIIMREFDMMALSKVVAMLGLAEVMRGPDLGRLLRMLLLLALILLGAWFVLGYLLPMLAAPLTPPPAAGVVVP